jgi:carbonic anhydrase
MFFMIRTQNIDQIFDWTSTNFEEKALQFLKEGNMRFVNNLKVNRNLLEQVNDTREGQWPFATVLSCIDSRTSAELIFDQGLGDIFSIRIAGNFANQDILGSMEFACNVAGSKLVVVLGHTKCGALKGGLDAPQWTILITLSIISSLASTKSSKKEKNVLLKMMIY